MKHYILDAEKNVLEASDEEARLFFQNLEARRVGYKEVGEDYISTVFLGYDTAHRDRGPPLCFETLVHLDGESRVLDAYVSWEEAEKMHRYYANMYEMFGEVVQPVAQTMPVVTQKRNVRL